MNTSILKIKAHYFGHRWLLLHQLESSSFNDSNDMSKDSISQLFHLYLFSLNLCSSTENVKFNVVYYRTCQFKLSNFAKSFPSLFSHLLIFLLASKLIDKLRINKPFIYWLFSWIVLLIPHEDWVFSLPFSTNAFNVQT